MVKVTWQERPEKLRGQNGFSCTPGLSGTESDSANTRSRVSRSPGAGCLGPNPRSTRGQTCDLPLVLLHFCHEGGAICISEVIDISPGNLDPSLCFIQSSISPDVLCIEVK